MFLFIAKLLLKYDRALPPRVELSPLKIVLCIVLAGVAVGIVALRIPSIDDVIDYRTTRAEAKKTDPEAVLVQVEFNNFGFATGSGGMPDMSKSGPPKMALYRNVRPLYLEQSDDREAVLHAAEKLLVDKEKVKEGDLIVLTIGEPMGKAGGTNAMKIVRVGEHV